MPTEHLKEYLENQNIFIDNLFTKGDSMSNISDVVNETINNDNPQVGVVESPNFNSLNNAVQTSLPKDSFPTEIV